MRQNGGRLIRQKWWTEFTVTQDEEIEVTEEDESKKVAKYEQ